MKWAITGGGGFIGRNLCERLLKLNQQVRLIPRETLYNQFELRAYLKSEQPDHIVHLAAFGNHSNQQNPEEIFSVNFQTTLNLLVASLDVPYQSLINTGSSSEYGLVSKAMSEQDLPLTKTYYGASKVATTYMTRAFGAENNKKNVTVRPFSVYGPGEADFRFIPAMSQALKNDKPVMVSPDTMHDWIYIDDFIDALLLIANKSRDIPIGQVINVGTGIQTSNADVVTVLEEIAGKKLLKSIGNFRNEVASDWYADNQLLKALGWSQKHSLREGLEKTYEYYQ